MSIVMDSRTREEPKPDADHLPAVQLLKFFAPPTAYTEIVDQLKAGGFGYGDLKKALFEHYWEFFREARDRRTELAANMDHVNAVLADGANRAREVARAVIDRARRASGIG